VGVSRVDIPVEFPFLLLTEEVVKLGLSERLAILTIGAALLTIFSTDSVTVETTVHEGI
jgi:hypothetical protein